MIDMSDSNVVFIGPALIFRNSITQITLLPSRSNFFLWLPNFLIIVDPQVD